MPGRRHRLAVPLLLLPLLLSGLLAGCDDGPTEPSGELLLQEALERWAAHGGDSYTVEARISCYCIPYLHTWTRLTVEGGVVIEAEPLAPPAGGDTTGLQGWRTVDEHFELIEHSVTSPWVARTLGAFDPILGYPLSVEVQCVSGIADCGSIHELRNLVLTPPED